MTKISIWELMDDFCSFFPNDEKEISFLFKITRERTGITEVEKIGDGWSRGNSYSMLKRLNYNLIFYYGYFDLNKDYDITNKFNSYLMKLDGDRFKREKLEKIKEDIQSLKSSIKWFTNVIEKKNKHFREWLPEMVEAKKERLRKSNILKYKYHHENCRNKNIQNR